MGKEQPEKVDNTTKTFLLHTVYINQFNLFSHYASASLLRCYRYRHVSLGLLVPAGAILLLIQPNVYIDSAPADVLCSGVLVSRTKKKKKKCQQQPAVNRLQRFEGLRQLTCIGSLPSCRVGRFVLAQQGMGRQPIPGKIGRLPTKKNIQSWLARSARSFENPSYVQKNKK